MQHMQFMWEVRVYVCDGYDKREDWTGQVGSGQIMKSFVFWVKRLGLDSVGSRNHRWIFSKVQNAFYKGHSSNSGMG